MLLLCAFIEMGAEICVKYYHRVKLVRTFAQVYSLLSFPVNPIIIDFFYTFPVHTHAYTNTKPLRCTKRDSPSGDETEWSCFRLVITPISPLS